MAIAFNLPGIPGQLRGTPEEAGAIPDLQQAISQGFLSSLEMQNKPKEMAQNLLANQLRNKMLTTQARYAEPMAETNYQKALFDLAHAREMEPLEKQYKQALIGKANRGPLSHPETAEEKEEAKYKVKSVHGIESDVDKLIRQKNELLQMKKIVENNKKYFGPVKGRFASLRHVKDLGTFKNLQSKFVSGLESELSQKGSVQALKAAQYYKTNVTDTPEQALGNLDSAIREIQNGINQHKYNYEKLTGRPLARYNLNNSEQTTNSRPTSGQSAHGRFVRKNGVLVLEGM